MYLKLIICCLFWHPWVAIVTEAFWLSLPHRQPKTKLMNLLLSLSELLSLQKCFIGHKQGGWLIYKIDLGEHLERENTAVPKILLFPSTAVPKIALSSSMSQSGYPQNMTADLPKQRISNIMFSPKKFCY